MLRAVVLVAVVAVSATAGADPGRGRAEVPVPRSSRSLGPDLVASGTSFRRTVAFYQRWLRREGSAHRAIPVYQRGDTVVARFLSRDEGSPWLAIHVFARGGRTRIVVVPRGAPSS